PSIVRFHRLSVCRCSLWEPHDTALQLLTYLRNTSGASPRLTGRHWVTVHPPRYILATPPLAPALTYTAHTWMRRHHLKLGGSSRNSRLCNMKYDDFVLNNQPRTKRLDGLLSYGHGSMAPSTSRDLIRHIPILLPLFPVRITVRPELSYLSFFVFLEPGFVCRDIVRGTHILSPQA
ncbi:hypothetical protein H4582DRAFT_1902273, partial [Lactarius indigo]